MALELSAKAKLLSQKLSINPQIILEIDGISEIFGAIQVTKLAQYGDDIVFGQANLVYGGVVENENSRNWISLDGTSKSITQQLLQDKGGSGSISSFKINLVDKDNRMSKLLQPGNRISDYLGRDAYVYLNFKNGAHPEDSVLVFQGIVDELDFAAGSVNVGIAHPEKLKNQDIFIQATAVLVSDLNIGSTTLVLDTVNNFLLPQDVLETYVRINEEIIKYTGFAGTTLTGVERAQFKTVQDDHAAGDEVVTYYRLQGNTLDLALKLLLSGGPQAFVSGLETPRFNQLTATEYIANSIFFNIYNVEKKYGLVDGDTITITGSSNGNDGTYIIDGFGELPTGSYVTVTSALNDELESSATASFGSQYNVLPDGCKLDPRKVDVAEHLNLKRLFLSSLLTYDFLLKETVKAKEFINTQIYFPNAMYQIPRKAKTSVGITLPAIAEAQTKTVDEASVIGPGKIKIKRSINKNFYNAVVYRFEQHPLSDRFLAGLIRQSAESTNRINVGNQPLTIDGQGLRDNAPTRALLEIQTRRFLDRYKFAAEHLKIEVTYKKGFDLEVGDTIIFGSPALKITDTKGGNRDFIPRLFEITNKSLNIVNGKIQLDITDTSFGLDGRFGTIGPSSLVDVGSSLSEIKIKKSFGTTATQTEKEKWVDYFEQNVLIRSPDFSFAHERKLVRFSSSNNSIMVIDPALPSVPQENYIIEMAHYPTSSEAKVGALWKTVHCFMNPEVLVVSSASNFSLEVAALDTPKFFVGSIIRVHNYDYTSDSGDVVVTEIVGNTITVNQDLGYTPNAGDIINLIGFPDQGLPYRYF